jgi:hypothetical protein
MSAVGDARKRQAEAGREPDLLAALRALADEFAQRRDESWQRYMRAHGSVSQALRQGKFEGIEEAANRLRALIAAHQPAEPERWDRDSLIAALAEEPQAMTLSHDRMILQRKDEGNDARVVLVRCPHTIGLCFETDDYLGLLPCPCNDRSEVVAELVPRPAFSQSTSHRPGGSDA